MNSPPTAQKLAHIGMTSPNATAARTSGLEVPAPAEHPGFAADCS